MEDTLPTEIAGTLFCLNSQFQAPVSRDDILKKINNVFPIQNFSTELNYRLDKYIQIYKQKNSIPIPRHSQTRAKNAGLLTLKTYYSSKYYHTHKRINK